MKKLTSVMLLIVVAVLGVAFAQAAADGQTPHTWSEVLQYLIQIGGPLAAAIAIGFHNPKELLGKKTTWAGVAAIAGAVVALAGGSVDMPTASYMILAGLVMIFLKDGQISAEKAASQAVSASELEASKARVNR